MKFEKYTNENGGEVTACIVTADDVGQTVRKTDNSTYHVQEGDVLVAAYRPQEYDVFQGSAAEEFVQNYKRDSGDSGQEDSADSPAVEEPDSGDSELFDPGTHTVSEVQEYLNGVSAEERNRVIRAEQQGKNRSSLTQ